MPDLVQVAEHSDPVELGRLLQLILGCAVKCERKQGMWLPVSYAFVYTNRTQTDIRISTVKHVLCSVDKKGNCLMKI